MTIGGTGISIHSSRGRSWWGAKAQLARREQRRPRTLSADERTRLLALGTDLRNVWQAPTTMARDKKELLRALLEEVIVTVNKDEGRAHLTLRWRGAALASLLLRDRATFQAAVGRAEALWGSARSFLLATVSDLWDEVSSGMAASMRQQALVRLACTQAAQSAAQAVDLMYNAGGGTSLYESSRLERCFRDVHACTQHIATSTDSYEAGGRVLLGLDPGRSQF